MPISHFLAFVFDRTTNAVNFLQQFQALARSDFNTDLLRALDQHIGEKTANSSSLGGLYFDFAVDCFLNEGGYMGDVTPAYEEFQPDTKVAHTFVLPGRFTAEAKSYLLAEAKNRTVRRLRLQLLDQGPDAVHGVSVFVSKFSSKRFPNALTPKFPDWESLRNYLGIYRKVLGFGRNVVEVEVQNHDFLTLVSNSGFVGEGTFGVSIEEVPTGYIWVQVSNEMIYPGEGVNLKATVQGMDNQEVRWSIINGEGGPTPERTGINTAIFKPDQCGTYQVRATSVADPSVTGDATTTVRVRMLITIHHEDIDPRTIKWWVTVVGGKGPFTVVWHYYIDYSKQVVGNPVTLDAWDMLMIPLVIWVTDADGHLEIVKWQW